MGFLGKGLLGLVGGLALAWSGLWFGAAEYSRQQAAAWFEAQTLSGRLAGHDGISMSGFPGRMVMQLDAPYLADPFLGLSWAAPVARVEADLPLRLRLPMAEQHTLMLGGHEVVDLRGRGMGAELRLDGPSLAFAALTAGAAAVEVDARAGWRAALAALDLTLEAAPGAADRLQLEAQLGGLRADFGALAALGHDRADWAEDWPLADPLDLRVSAALALRAPLDRHHAADPVPEEIAVEALGINWGAARIDGAGTLNVAPDGELTGRLDLRIRDWRDLMARIVALGLLHPDAGETWTNALATMEEGGVLDLPLSFRGGRTRLGPLPIGDAPVLRW